MSKLLQVALNETLLDKLKRVAKSKGVNTSAYVKFVLVQNIQAEDENMLTENGFNLKEEERLLNSWQNTRLEQKAKQTQSADVSDFLNQL